MVIFSGAAAPSDEQRHANGGAPMVRIAEPAAPSALYDWDMPSDESGDTSTEHAGSVMGRAPDGAQPVSILAGSPTTKGEKAKGGKVVRWGNDVRDEDADKATTIASSNLRRIRRAAEAHPAEEEKEDKKPKLPLKVRVRNLFTEPDTSPAAMYISVWFLFLIALSTVAFMLETVPSLSSDPEYGDASNEQIWFWSETFFVSFFTFEYVVCWVVAEDRLLFPFQPFNIIDFLAIAPYYLELAISSKVNLRFIRVVRLARVFRALKMGKKYEGASVLVRVLQTAAPTLVPPFFFLFLGMVFFSALMYVCEQGEYDPRDGRFYVTDTNGHRVESSFISIPESLWWAIVTMTTVGYGDYTPKTAFGRVVNFAAMIFGVTFSAMPIAVIGSSFTVMWDEMRMKLNASRDFQANDALNNTSGWGPNQVRFFGMEFEDSARTSVNDFVFGRPRRRMRRKRSRLLSRSSRTPSKSSHTDTPGGGSAEFPDADATSKSSGSSIATHPCLDSCFDPLGVHERPETFVSRALNHELMTNRDKIEKGSLPKTQWNLAFKIYHVMRAESSRCENNIETYTEDFVAELLHVLGFAQYDEQSNVFLGFRSRAGLAVSFGEGRNEKLIRSDSDLGVFAMPDAAHRKPVFFFATDSYTTGSTENIGRIAGELLAVAQANYKSTKFTTSRTVFLVTFSGYHLKFYAAEFTPTYLDAVARGRPPTNEKVQIRYFPPDRNMHFTKSTIMGTFDFLTPSHRETAIEAFLRIKRLMISACTNESVEKRRQRMLSKDPSDPAQSALQERRSSSMLLSPSSVPAPITTQGSAASSHLGSLHSAASQDLPDGMLVVTTVMSPRISNICDPTHAPPQATPPDALPPVAPRMPSFIEPSVPAVPHSTPPDALPPVAPRLPSLIELSVSSLLSADSATGSAVADKPADKPASKELSAPAPQQPASPRGDADSPAASQLVDPEMADADTDLVSSARTPETPPARPQHAVDAFSLNGDPKR